METNDKERKEYRKMLNECADEFEMIYRKDSFSFINAKRLCFRIWRILAKYDRTRSLEEFNHKYQKPDIKAIIDCEPEVRK